MIDLEEERPRSRQSLAPIATINLTKRDTEYRTSQTANHQRILEMQEAKNRLLAENRKQMNEMFGSGQGALFDNLRDQFSEVDVKGISILQDKKERITNVGQINDTVYKSFDAIEREQLRKEAALQ